MSRAVIVHPGFHKTGTTSLQAALAENRELLRPHVEIFLRKDMPAVCRSAKLFSASHDQLDMAFFVYELSELLAACDPDDPRPLLLSSEDLVGYMPGRRGVRGYDAAPRLAATIREVVRDVLGTGARLCFHVSTRRHGWLQSLYWQLLLSERMRLDQAQFKARFRHAADLDSAAGAIVRAVAPCPVTIAALEDMTGPLGPLAPLLDRLEIPDGLRARLAPPIPRNTRGGPKLRARMLRVNRGDLSDRAALRRRRRMLREWRARYNKPDDGV